MAEGEGFEPPVRLPVRLISSQVPLTTQPPFHAGPLLCSISPARQAIRPRRTASGGAMISNFRI
jgi:hypothetical protein